MSLGRAGDIRGHFSSSSNPFHVCLAAANIKQRRIIAPRFLNQRVRRATTDRRRSSGGQTPYRRLYSL